MATRNRYAKGRKVEPHVAAQQKLVEGGKTPEQAAKAHPFKPSAEALDAHARAHRLPPYDTLPIEEWPPAKF